MGTEHTAKAQQRRAGKPRNLPGYMWANTTYAYGTVEPPTVCEPEAFARAWIFDYLAGTYPHGLCDDCGTFDTEDAAAIVVREALENRAAETDHRACRTPDRDTTTDEHLAHLTFRLISACEAEIIAQETARWPWHWVIAAHANECPAHLADAAEDAFNHRLAYGY